jgi:hypothetical protein
MTDKKRQYKECSAVLGTLTSAQKAQKVLSGAAIPTSIGKSESSSLHRGCVWSVNFSCNQKENVMSVLASSGIKVRAWSMDDDILG